MSGGDEQLGRTKFTLFVKGLQGGTMTFEVHKVKQLFAYVLFCGQLPVALLATSFCVRLAWHMVG